MFVLFEVIIFKIFMLILVEIVFMFSEMFISNLKKFIRFLL